MPESASRAKVELVDTGQIPNGGHLRLLRCGADYSIQFGQDELMGSEAAQSEEALAQLAIRRLDTGCGRMLIGGLGMGFTLGAALEALPSNASVVVAELVPKVVEWARGPLAHLFGNMLDDPRVSIVISDVHDVIITSPGHFDAILLDVDNGPDGFIRPENDRLYCNWGLRAAYAALRPGGVLAIWSAYDDPRRFHPTCSTRQRGVRDGAPRVWRHDARSSVMALGCTGLCAYIRRTIRDHATYALTYIGLQTRSRMAETGGKQHGSFRQLS
jgi:spermidine synthase